MTISFDLALQISCVSARVTGTDANEQPSSVVAGKLVDIANSFTNVTVGDVVVLTDDPRTYTTVTAVDSATQLSLDKDIITSTDSYYYVLTAADAFKVRRDNSGGEDYNFLTLFSPGDIVDSDSVNVIDNWTINGGAVVSVDDVGQLTTDTPMGGYEGVSIARQNAKSLMSLEGVNVIFGGIDNGDISLTDYVGDIDTYPVLYANTEAQYAGVLANLKEVITQAVGGGYRNVIPVDQELLGGYGNPEI